MYNVVAMFKENKNTVHICMVSCLYHFLNYVRCNCHFYVSFCFHNDDSENVTFGPREDRMMITGKHTVADIYCVVCGSILGWKYVRSGFLRSYGLCILSYQLIVALVIYFQPLFDALMFDACRYMHM
jgi:hypothetical protein